MAATLDEDKIARLALELVVQRLASRVTRNHPRAFDDLIARCDLLPEGAQTCDRLALVERIDALVGRSA